jgi:hypothetical protein
MDSDSVLSVCNIGLVKYAKRDVKQALVKPPTCIGLSGEILASWLGRICLLALFNRGYSRCVSEYSVLVTILVGGVSIE